MAARGPAHEAVPRGGDERPEAAGEEHDEHEEPGAGGQQLRGAVEEVLGPPHVGGAEEGGAEGPEPAHHDHGEGLDALAGIEAGEPDAPEGDRVEPAGQAAQAAGEGEGHQAGAHGVDAVGRGGPLVVADPEDRSTGARARRRLAIRSHASGGDRQADAVNVRGELRAR